MTKIFRQISLHFSYYPVSARLAILSFFVSKIHKHILQNPGAETTCSQYLGNHTALFIYQNQKNGTTVHFRKSKNKSPLFFKRELISIEVTRKSTGMSDVFYKARSSNMMAIECHNFKNSFSALILLVLLLSEMTN